jgi:hypothetical protein
MEEMMPIEKDTATNRWKVGVPGILTPDGKSLERLFKSRKWAEEARSRVEISFAAGQIRRHGLEGCKANAVDFLAKLADGTTEEDRKTEEEEERE